MQRPLLCQRRKQREIGFGRRRRLLLCQRWTWVERRRRAGKVEVGGSEDSRLTRIFSSQPVRWEYTTEHDAVELVVCILGLEFGMVEAVHLVQVLLAERIRLRSILEHLAVDRAD